MIRRSDDRLTLTIEDNGVSFDASQTTDGFGLLSLRERAAMMCGTLDMDTAPGEGTRVTLQIPLRAASG